MVRTNTDAATGDETTDRLAEQLGKRLSAGDALRVTVDLYDRSGTLTFDATVHESADLRSAPTTIRIDVDGGDPEAYLLKPAFDAVFVDGLVGADDGRIGEVVSIEKTVFDTVHFDD